VHTKASAGASSEQYGSDAKDVQTQDMHEYKSKTMTPRQERLFCNGKFSNVVKMVYNGAYKEDAIEKYKEIRHNLTLFSEETGKLIAVVEVPSKEVVDQLLPLLKRRQDRIAKGLKPSTNGASVTIKFDKSVPTIGKIVWLDSSMKSKK
jgi:hypothetical protein